MKKWVFMILMILMLGWAIYDLVASNSEASDEFEIADEMTDEDSEDIEVGLNVDSMAPDFELTTLSGEQVKLSDFRGERVMLNFWATWCPPCRAEMPDMEDFYQDTDVTILAVNLTESEVNMENVENFVQEYELTFPVLLDEDAIVASTYSIQPIPTTYMIDSSGKINYTAYGPMNYDLMVQELEKTD